jgi:spermidine synthase
VFEVLDVRPTPLGEIALRRRSIPDGTVVHEIHLDGALLMSSLVHEAERALATRALAELDGARASVLVGGLGMGHTADAALGHPGVERVVVVELLPEVIGWHRRGLVPLGARLVGDARCSLVAADVFACLRGEGPAGTEGPFDAVLLDVDHTPEHLLHPAHGAFYEPAGLRAARERLRPGGVLGLWAAGPGDPAFLARLRAEFREARADEVSFWNPLNDADEVNAVYLARA